MRSRAKARAASDPTSPSGQPAAAPVQPAKPKPKKQTGFALRGQPGPDRAPHQLKRPGRVHRKGAGKTQRDVAPRKLPTPEKVTSKRGKGLLGSQEAAGGALHWAEYFGAAAGYSQAELAEKMGVDPSSLTRNRQRKDETGGYAYIEPNGVGAPRLLDPEMEAALCWYIENVDARLTLEQYGAIAQSVEGLKELKKSLSGQTVQRTITDREVEKGHKPVTDKEVQITPWYANLPRFLDMCASYLEFVKRVGDDKAGDRWLCGPQQEAASGSDPGGRCSPRPSLCAPVF